MSDFLAFESFLISLGATTTQTRDTLAAALTSRGWQVVAKGVAYSALASTNWVTPLPALDNADSYYNTGAGSVPCIISLTLGASGILNKYDLVAENGGTYSYSPKSWTVEWSDNNITWTVADTRTNEPLFARGEKRTYTIGGSPGSHLYWRLNVTAVGNGTVCYIAEWRPWLTTGEFVSAKDWLYVIPPATESIGNSVSRGVAAISISPTQLSVQPCVEYLQAMPQVFSLSEKTAGAVAATAYISNGSSFAITATLNGTTLTVTACAGTLGIGSIIQGPGVIGWTVITALGTGTGGNGTYTVNVSHPNTGSIAMNAWGVTAVSGATGNTGSTAKDNLRALYVALRASADPKVTDFTWSYQKASPQNADDTLDWIVGVRTTLAAIKDSPAWVSGNANVNVYQAGEYRPAGVVPADMMPGMATPTLGTMGITIDLNNGFIYYLQINARGFALATKTNANFFGPLHACWADHTKALAVMPTTFDPRWCGVNELLVGYDNAATSNLSVAIPAKMMVLPSKMSTSPTQAYDMLGSSFYGVFAASGFRYRNQFCDMITPSTGSPFFNTFAPLAASGIFAGTNEQAADDFQIHRMAMQGTAEVVLSCASPAENNIAAVTPALDITDWYKFRGTATNESLALVADTVNLTTLGQAMDDTTAYTTLNIGSTAGFAAAGFIVIENEIIQYTGLSGGDTLTGVTRARYGTAKQQHWVGDAVYQGLWFTIINGGALLCGPTKPS